jgi:hypothetical protein
VPYDPQHDAVPIDTPGQGTTADPVIQIRESKSDRRRWKQQSRFTLRESDGPLWAVRIKMKMKMKHE